MYRRSASLGTRMLFREFPVEDDGGSGWGADSLEMMAITNVSDAVSELTTSAGVGLDIAPWRSRHLDAQSFAELMERMSDMGIDPGEEDLKSMLASRGLQRQLMAFYLKTSAEERVSRLAKVLDRDHVTSIAADETAQPEVLLGLSLLLSSLFFLPLFFVNPAEQFHKLSGSTLQQAVSGDSFRRSRYFAVGCCAPLLFETIHSCFFPRPPAERSMQVHISLMRNIVVFAVLLSSLLIIGLVEHTDPKTTVLPVSTYIVVRQWTYDVLVSAGTFFSLKNLPGLILSRPWLIFGGITLKAANLLTIMASLSNSLQNQYNWAALAFQITSLTIFLYYFTRLLLLFRARSSCSVVRTAVAMNTTFFIMIGVDYLLLAADATTYAAGFAFVTTLAVVVLCKLALSLAGNYLVTTKARFRDALGTEKEQEQEQE